MNELVHAEIEARIETLRKNAEFHRGLAKQNREDLATAEAQAKEADALADGYTALLAGER